jgi:hypothetical protein
MSDQLILFNLKEFESVRSNPVYDPYWDELEKDLGDILDQPLLCNNPEIVTRESAVPCSVQQIFSDYSLTTQTESVSEYNRTILNPSYSLTTQTESVSEYAPTPSTPPYSLTTQTESVSEYNRTILNPSYSLTTQTESVSEYTPTPSTPPYSLTTQTESVSEYTRTISTPPYSLTNDPQGINVYSPGGTATKGKHKYFRCSCKHGRTTRHIHIPGGNIKSVLAQNNAEIIRQAFALGRSYEEIRQIVRSLPSARRWGRT